MVKKVCDVPAAETVVLSLGAFDRRRGVVIEATLEVLGENLSCLSWEANVAEAVLLLAVAFGLGGQEPSRISDSAVGTSTFRADLASEDSRLAGVAMVSVPGRSFTTESS